MDPLYSINTDEISYNLPDYDDIEESFSYLPESAFGEEVTYNLAEGEAPNETVIKLSKGVYLYKSPTGHLGYIYSVSEDISFFFTMLCEVGQPWQPDYQKYFESQGWKIETAEIRQSPWMIDRVKD